MRTRFKPDAAAFPRFKMANFREAKPDEVIDPAERKRVAAGLSALAERFSNRQQKQIDKRYAEPLAEKLERYRTVPPKVGPRLAAQFERERQEKEPDDHT